jgi:hypothetical protein
MAHTITNGAGSVWGGNPQGGPRNFTIMGSLQPTTIRYGRAPTPNLRLPNTEATASVTQQGRTGRVRNIQGEKTK